MKADSLEWLTQYNRGKEDDIIASLLNYGATKKEDAGAVTAKGQEHTKSDDKSKILFEKDKGIDHLVNDQKAAEIAQVTKVTTGSATEPLPNLPPG